MGQIPVSFNAPSWGSSLKTSVGGAVVGLLTMSFNGVSWGSVLKTPVGGAVLRVLSGSISITAGSVWTISGVGGILGILMGSSPIASE